MSEEAKTVEYNCTTCDDKETSELKEEVVTEAAEAGEGDSSPEPVESQAPSDEAADNDHSSAQTEEIDWKDKYLRLHADWENYRKRMDEQRSDERARATENLMKELIPLIDDMKNALEWADKNGSSEMTNGFKAIDTKFRCALEKHGLQEIDPAGEAFDPLMHQAVSTVPDDSVYDETVRDVYQKGYKLGIKVIRPAMVTITTGGEKRPAEDLNDSQKDEGNKED